MKVKNKLRGTISDQNNEIEQLKQQIEALKPKPQAPNAQDAPPNMTDFDTDAEYNVALAEYIKGVTEKQVKSQAQILAEQRAVEKAQMQLQANVDQHYQRAQQLVDKGNVQPEIIRTADTQIRQAIEQIRPQQGDMIVDQLISSMGEGSEKVG